MSDPKASDSTNYTRKGKKWKGKNPTTLYGCSDF